MSLCLSLIGTLAPIGKELEQLIFAGFLHQPNYAPLAATNCNPDYKVDA